MDSASLGNILAAALDAQADPRLKRPLRQTDQSAPLLGRTRMPPDLFYDSMSNNLLPERVVGRLDTDARKRRL